MARDNRNLELGVLDEESLGFLLGDEIRIFHNDGFEGSREEHHIFTEVFYGKNMCDNAKRCADVGITNSESDENNQSRTLVNLNGVCSVLTCPPSLKELYGGERIERFKENNVDISSSGHIQEKLCREVEFDVCNLKSKQLALSYEGFSDFPRNEQGFCLSDTSNDFHASRPYLLDLNHMPQQTLCRIVESFSQGIISSCYFPSHYDETDGPDDTDHDMPSRSNASSDLIRDMKVDGEGKVIAVLTAPVSPENFVSKPLMVDGHNTLYKSEEFKIFDSDVADSSEALVRELPDRLRLHAHNLLRDAGWKIEARRRKGRSKLDSVFKTPGKGLVINSLSKAWRACGKGLVANSINSIQEENSRQWSQVDVFWHDLRNAMACIEKKIQYPQNSLSLLRRWHLLDPYVSVVCIDKKIGALREGRRVKFVKGRSIAAKAGISVENQHVKSTQCSVCRSSHCRSPCKHGNICTPISSSLNCAIVDESVLTVVKPKYVETSCNKKLDHRAFSEFHMPDLNHMPQQKPCRIAEPFSRGIISSCCFPSRYDETDDPDDIDDDIPSKNNASSDLSRDNKVDDSGKALVSPGSSASKLLIVDGSNTLSMNEESKLFDSDADDSSEPFVRDLPNRLRLHAHNLLLDAGWKIEARRRKDGSKLDSVFKPPGKGLVIYSLSKAWRACGEVLVAGGINATQEENSRQWLQIDVFWHDLRNALAYIEKEIQHKQNSLSLLHRWHQLDPFVSVICINKKIRALREGRGLKFVKGRLIQLPLNKTLCSSAKASINVENQPVKSTQYSVCRSSHCPPPCENSNICTSLASSLNRAIGGGSVPTVEKPKLIETSCNKKLVHKTFPGVHMLVHYDSKRKHQSGKLNRKLSFGWEVKRRSLESQARSIGNGYYDWRLHNMKRKASKESKQKSTSFGVPSLIRKSSTLSKTTSPSNVSLSICSQISKLDSQKQPLRSLGAASTKKSIHHKGKKNVVASDPCKNFLTGSLPCEEVACSRQMPILCPKEGITSYGRNGKRSRGVSAYGETYNACNGIMEAEQLGGLDSSVLHRNSHGMVLCLASDGKISAKNNCAYKEKNTALWEEMKGDVLEKAAALGNGASFSQEKQMNCHLAVGPKPQFLYTQQETLCFGIDKNCVVEKGICGKPMDAVREVHIHPDSCSSVYQLGSVSGVLVLGLDSNVTQGLNFAAEQPICRDVPNSFGKKIEEDILLSPEHLKEECADAIKTFKSGTRHTSAPVPGKKKVSKRSKKIPAVAAIKLQHKDVNASPPNEMYEGEIGLDLDDKMSNNFDFLPCEGVENVLKMETVTWSLTASKNNEVLNRSIIRSSETAESSSAVTEICTVGQKRKKHEKPGTWSVKIKRKCKKGAKREVLSKIASLNMDSDQEYVVCQIDNNESHGESVTFSKATSTSSLQHSKTKALPIMGSKSKMPVGVASHSKSLVRLQDESDTIKASFFSEQKYPVSQTNQKAAEGNNSEGHKESGRKRKRGDVIDDDDLLIAAIIKNKDLSSDGTHSSCNVKRSQSKGCRKLKSRKGNCKLLLCSPGKSGTHLISGARTPLAWLLNSGVVSLNAAIQYRSQKNNTILKDGRVTREGILCKCCNKILSMSTFKCHAGYKLSRSSLNLFLESGKSYALCQLKAWSDEYKARKDGKQVVEVEEVDQNDDTCGLCADGGELICCDNCPSTFHQACLHSQDIPDGHWYCTNCTCKICGGSVAEMARGPSIILECSQCEQKYHDKCLTKKGSSNDRLISDTWFCAETCEKVYFGLRSRVGVMNSISDGFAWTILRCNHSDQKLQSAQKIAQMAECNSKLAVALTIMEECFLPIIDPRTGINMILQVLYNWGSNFPRLNYHGFYTIILEKDDEIISVATIRVHGVTLAEMPLIATCSEHRRQGMCRRLMGAIEEMLKSFKVEMLVLSAIPDLIDTWTSSFGFKPISDDERRQLSTINLMLFPGAVLLTKALCEALEMKKPEEKFSSSREDLNHVTDFSDTRTDLLTLKEPGPNSFTAKTDLTVGTTPHICTNLQVYEQEDCQRLNLPMSSSSKALTIFAGKEPADIANSVSFREASSILGCDLLTDLRSSLTYKEIRDVEGSSSGNIGIAIKERMMNDLHNKEFMAHPPESDKINDVKITENLKGKSDCNALERFDPLNPSNLSLTGIDDVSTSIDFSTQCEELLSSTANGCVPAAEAHSTMGSAVNSVNGTGNGNPSTLACINEVKYPDKVDPECTTVVLKKVVIPVSITKCNRIPCILSEGNFQENLAPCGICSNVMGENIGKKGCNYSCCDGIYENVQDRDILMMKVGRIPQRETIMNNVKSMNLSQKTVINCSEAVLAEVEKSLWNLSLCYGEDQEKG